MMHRPLAIVLCEDLAQFTFIRGFLLQRGFNTRNICPKMSPSGKGDGIRFVLDQYPLELAAVRNASKPKSLLIAVMDGDGHSVQERKSALNDKKNLGEIASRSNKDLVAIVVPKRAIETWCAFLDGQAIEIEEEEDYSRLFRKSESKGKYGKELHDWCCKQSPTQKSSGTPESLLDACREWNQMKNVAGF